MLVHRSVRGGRRRGRGGRGERGGHSSRGGRIGKGGRSTMITTETNKEIPFLPIPEHLTEIPILRAPSSKTQDRNQITADAARRSSMRLCLAVERKLNESAAVHTVHTEDQLVNDYSPSFNPAHIQQEQQQQQQHATPRPIRGRRSTAADRGYRRGQGRGRVHDDRLHDNGLVSSSYEKGRSSMHSFDDTISLDKDFIQGKTAATSSSQFVATLNEEPNEDPPIIPTTTSHTTPAILTNILQGTFRIRKSHKQTHMLSSWSTRFVSLTPTGIVLHKSEKTRNNGKYPVREVPFSSATSHRLVIMEELSGTDVALVCSSSAGDEPMYMTTVGSSKDTRAELILRKWNDEIQKILAPYEKCVKAEIENNLKAIRTKFKHWRSYAGDHNVDQFWDTTRNLTSFNVKDADIIRDMLICPCGDENEYEEEVELLVALESETINLNQTAAINLLRSVILEEKEVHMQWNNISAPRLSTELFSWKKVER